MHELFDYLFEFLSFGGFEFPEDAGSLALHHHDDCKLAHVLVLLLIIMRDNADII